jgi:glutamine amidotransferase
MTVAIVDHGHANIRSVDNMLRYLGERPVIARTPSDLKGCDKLILPGIGAFDAVRRRLAETGFDEAVSEFALAAKKPVLGICVGMRVMLQGSAEGREAGLGWFGGTCTRFAASPGETLRVPHMGWSVVTPVRHGGLFAGLPVPARYYFVHSYRLAEGQPGDVAGTADYGGTFVAALERDNLFAVQFHPEKSHRFGVALYRAFLAL